ncbi:MAG: lactonase family protein [Planctomycetaceae bacterium]|nr:lactonase family protein [Planctomycetaceae bacterium]
MMAVRFSKCRNPSVDACFRSGLSFVWTCFLVFGTALIPQSVSAQDIIDVWIGTGRSSLSRGIYHTTLNCKTGKLSSPVLAAEADAPGFLAMHPKRPVIYAVATIQDEPCVAAYSIEGAPGKRSLALLNTIEIGDGGAAHLSVDRTGQFLVTAQYGGGSVALFTLNTDGSLKQRIQIVDHEGGSKVTPGRQDSSHAHWAGFSADRRFVLVPDLGLDQVVIYQFDAVSPKLVRHGAGILPPGSGPRHMKFHPDGKHILVLNEIGMTVTVFAWDAKAGTMTPVNTVFTIPESDLSEKGLSTSEIRIHENGRFVYAANRGHDTISVFHFEPRTAALTLLENVHVRGATPRNFNLDPTGHWLIVGGQDSHTLASFEIDQQSGRLTYNRSIVHAPSAICVLFGFE